MIYNKINIMNHLNCKTNYMYLIKVNECEIDKQIDKILMNMFRL